MKIALIGYGKMGKAIEGIATERGHTISHKFDINSKDELFNLKQGETDAAIEFTQPGSAYANVKHCVENAIPVVCGTTGWLDKKEEIEHICLEKGGSFFYASNFSVGVNIFFKVNEYLAKLMEKYSEYAINMEEIHHTQKLDAPSGTAITLAEGILNNVSRKDNWELAEGQEVADKNIGIVAKREPEVPGTHSISYASSIDSIDIKHTAHTRHGFALGSVLAAEFSAQNKGILSMDNLLGL